MIHLNRCRRQIRSLIIKPQGYLCMLTSSDGQERKYEDTYLRHGTAKDFHGRRGRGMRQAGSLVGHRRRLVHSSALRHCVQWFLCSPEQFIDKNQWRLLRPNGLFSDVDSCQTTVARVVGVALVGHWTLALTRSTV